MASPPIASASHRSRCRRPTPLSSVTDHWTSRLDRLRRSRLSGSGKAGTLTLKDAEHHVIAKTAIPSHSDHVPARWEALRPALASIAPLCRALAYVHGEGVVHCDLKPENVVLDRRGLPVLVDFGIADQVGARIEHDALEVAGVQAGTPHYISPEQIRGDQVDARADLYALGCILYEMITGRPPFLGSSPMSVIIQHMSQPHRPPSHWVPDLPDEIDELCARLLAKRPEDRLGHARAVIRRLERAGIPCEATWSEPVPDARPYLYRPSFSGREEIASQIEDALDRCVVAHGFSLRAIGGESGVGKSRLAAEIARAARARSMPVLSGQAQPSMASAPSGAPLHLFAPILRAIADACIEQGEDAFERLLARRAALLAPYAPFLTELPGYRALTEVGSVDPSQARARLFYALDETLRAMSDERPSLLLLDDVHGADELSRAALLAIIERAHAEPPPWVMLWLYASDEVPPWLGRALTLIEARGIGTCERLERLDRYATSAIAAQMLGQRRPPRELLAFIAARTHGNPFYVAEYLRDALDAGVMYLDDQGRWRLDESARARITSRVDVPHSVQAIARSRLERLPATLRAVCQAAALLGQHARPDHLRALGLIPESVSLEGALEELATRDLISSQHIDYVHFSHDQLRQAAYDTIAPGARQTLHERAAIALGDEAPGEQLGHHWERAGQRARAMHHYLRGARSARARAALSLAADLYARASQLAEDPQRALTLDLEAARSCWAYLPEQRREHVCQLEDIVRRARELGDDVARAEALAIAGDLYRQSGDLARARRMLIEARDRYAQLASGHGQAQVALALGRLAIASGDLARAEREGDRALATARRIGDRAFEARATEQLAEVAWRLGNPRTALSFFTQALSLHQLVGDARAEAIAHIWLSQLAIERGDDEAASSRAEHALRMSREHADPSAIAQATLVLSRVARARGDLARAQARAEAALDGLAGLDDPHHEVLAMAEIAACALAQGEPARAHTLFARARERASDSPSSWALGAFEQVMADADCAPP